MTRTLMRWIIAVGNPVESSLFYTLGTQRRNTVVAQQAHHSQCDRPLEELAVDATLPAGITSSTHLIACRCGVSLNALAFGGTFNAPGVKNNLCVCTAFVSGGVSALRLPSVWYYSQKNAIYTSIAIPLTAQRKIRYYKNVIRCLAYFHFPLIPQARLYGYIALVLFLRRQNLLLFL